MNKDFYKFLVKEKFKKDRLKFLILSEIDKNNCDMSRLLEVVHPSMALVCFHLNGNLKTPNGLLRLGLVEKVFKDDINKTFFYFRITKLGKEVLEILGDD